MAYPPGQAGQRGGVMGTFQPPPGGLAASAGGVGRIGGAINAGAAAAAGPPTTIGAMAPPGGTQPPDQGAVGGMNKRRTLPIGGVTGSPASGQRRPRKRKPPTYAAQAGARVGTPIPTTVNAMQRPFGGGAPGARMSTYSK